MYIKLYTLEGIIEGVVWASIYAEYQNIIKKGKLVACLSKKDKNQFSVKKIKDFFEWKEDVGR